MLDIIKSRDEQIFVTIVNTEHDSYCIIMLGFFYKSEELMTKVTKVMKFM